MKQLNSNTNIKGSLMSTKVSVVIPVYNGEAFIERAIQSIFNQSIQPYEVVVVNDGSRDGTAAKLAEFGDEITVITITNAGVANARNVGIKACTGDYIAFLDADDVWYTNKLEIQLDAFAKFPQVAFCCCDYDYFDKASNAIKNHFARFKSNNLLNYDTPLKKSGFTILININFVGTCSTVIFKRELINKVGLFDVSLKQSEDYDMWLKFALVTNFIVLSDQLIEKKTHETNLTNNFLETMLCHENVLINLRANKLASDQLVNIESEYSFELAKLRYFIGNLSYEANHKLQAFKYYFIGLGTTLTLENMKMFTYFFGRKLLRTISFGVIRNK